MTKTSTVTIRLDNTEAISLQTRKLKLCIARMVENKYSAIWDIRSLSSGDTVYTFTNVYKAVVASDALDTATNVPAPITASVTVATGQTLTYSGGQLSNGDAKFHRAGTKDEGSRSFTYQNLSDSNGGTATKTRLVVLQDLKCSAGSVSQLPLTSSNAVAVTDVVDAGKHVPIAPCWNVYCGSDGLGGSVDSIALWWTDSEEKYATGNAMIKDDIKPDIESNFTTCFSMAAGKNVTATFDDTDSWSLTSD